MPPPPGEGMTGSPPLDLPHPCARAGDPTGVPLTPATRREATSFLLRHHKLAPDDGAGVKDLRPLTRSALPDRSWTPTPQTGAAQKRRRTKEKRSTSRGTASLTGQVPFRDDDTPSRPSAAATTLIARATVAHLPSKTIDHGAGPVDQSPTAPFIQSAIINRAPADATTRLPRPSIITASPPVLASEATTCSVN
jgi:hypothetical protein